MSTLPRFIEFSGIKYGLSGRYYRKWNYSRPGPSNLHRAIWEHHNGPIPPDHDIHHKDGVGTNNDLANLECIPASDHQREHTLERIAQGVLKPPGATALALAAEWHASPAGIEWHSEHGKRTWDDRPWYPCKCENCGKDYRSPFPDRSKYCHPNCKQDARRRRQGIGVRPYLRKPRVMTGKRSA